MLGSATDADDAVQEAWLRIRDQDPGSVENMRAWLTTIVGRVCLNMLRSRRSRREEFAPHVPDPVVSCRESPPGRHCRRTTPPLRVLTTAATRNARPLLAGG